jgi:hypothetical protein
MDKDDGGSVKLNEVKWRKEKLRMNGDVMDGVMDELLINMGKE